MCILRGSSIAWQVYLNNFNIFLEKKRLLYEQLKQMAMQVI